MTSQAQALAQPVAGTKTRKTRGLSTSKQLLLQAACIGIAITVLFPLVWIVSMSLNPLNVSRPNGLNLIPANASLEAYSQVLKQPTDNPVSFPQLALNSLFLAVVIAAVTVGIGIFAAYAFSRLKFRGRELLMIAVLAVLMIPAVATLAPLFVMLNSIRVGPLNIGPIHIGLFNLRNSLIGVSLAVIATQLPFATWNMKGYMDTIPRDLEEAAAVDGANRFQIFRRIIIPLATPVIAITFFFGFLAGWTEFYFSWTFLTNPENFTLSMALNGMIGQYAGQTPWSQLAAFSILMALPVSVVYLLLQRYIVSGLTVGGVKG